MLEEMGVDTGVDFARLMKATGLIEQVLNTQAASHTSRQGRPAWQGNSGQEPPPACSGD